MVRQLLSALTLYVLMWPLAAAEFRLELSGTEVEMGKQLSAELIYQGQANVGEANLEQWQEYFFIDRGDIEIDNLITGQIQTKEMLRLYPRQTGEQVLEAVALGGAILKPVRIKVTPSVRHGIDGTPRWQALPEKIWQGQTINACLELTLFNDRNYVKIGEASFPEFLVEKLSKDKRLQNGLNQVSQCWQLTAKASGIHRLSAPSIEQRGRGRWKYYLTQPSIQVLPLPSYLPPSVPVGLTTLNTDVITDNDNRYWRVTVSNNGIFETEAYGIRSALAKVANVESDDITVKKDFISTQQQRQYRQIYKVALPTFAWGMGQGPVISLRYFDTRDNQLKIMTGHLPAVWQLPPWLQAVLWGLGGLMLYGILVYLYRLLKQLANNQKFKVKIRQAGDAHELRHLLLESKTPAFNSLSQWADSVSDRRAGDIASKLNHLCFATEVSDSLTELKTNLNQLKIAACCTHIP